MLEKIKKELEVRMKGQLDSRHASHDEVALCWLVSEVERLRKLAKLNNHIIHDSVVEKQAAWIEWQNGGGAEEAMRWIHNSLWGPGFVPDEKEIEGQSPQEFYEKNCWAATTGLNT